MTVTVPAEPAGAVILIVVAVFALMVAGLPVPKVTEVAPARFVPVMLTNAPAVNGPEDGEIPVTVGGTGVEVTLMNVAFVNVLDPPELVAVRFTE